MGNEDDAGGAATTAGAQPGRRTMPMMPSNPASRRCAGGCGQSRLHAARPGRWRALGCLLPAAGLLLAPGVPAAHAEALHLYSTMKSTNTPGLRCWGSRVGMGAPVVVYDTR